LHLFSIRAFSVVSLVGFIVGFAMFGAITYLPVFFQIVHGESPTTSGLQLLPLLVGLIICSTGSGIVISKTGRYRAFSITGTAFLVSWLIPQVELRQGVGASTGPPSDPPTAPSVSRRSSDRAARTAR
jgi:MFS family permease